MGAACPDCKGLASNGEEPVFCSRCNPKPAPAKAAKPAAKKVEPETAED